MAASFAVQISKVNVACKKVRLVLKNIFKKIVITTTRNKKENKYFQTMFLPVLYSRYGLAA